MKNDSLPTIAVIGAGPAGIAAAIQLKRYDLDAVLFEKEALIDNGSENNSGSLLKNAHLVENYLGFPDGLTGMVLLQKFHQQLQRNKIISIAENVNLLDYLEREKLFVLTTNKKIYHFTHVIVASGTKPKHHVLVENAKFARCSTAAKRKISYEVFPLLHERDKKIAVIGAGDAAFDYALSLLGCDNSVTIFNHGDRIKALPLLRRAVFDSDKFNYHANVRLIKINMGQLGDLVLTFATNAIDGKTGSIDNHDSQVKLLVANFDCLLVATGREPRKDFYTESLQRIEKNLIRLGVLYLAGDVKGDIYRQTTIAVADGIYAAMKIAADAKIEVPFAHDT